MRTAKANDHWIKSENRTYCNFLESINLNGFIGINKIELGAGIQCICGLNGVGKSSIIAAIKSVLGLNVDEQDIIKIGNHIFDAKIRLNNNIIECSNIKGKTLLEQLDDDVIVRYIDATQSIRIINFYLNQDNIDELIEQNEPIELGCDDVKDINYIVGREYSRVVIYEINDISDYDTVPFFVITEGNISYDTRKMGLGEHFLLYMYWNLYKTQKNSMVLIEEPESFVGIKSQSGIMNIIAKKSSEDGCSFILTTHSPYILNRIKNDNVNIVYRLSNIASIMVPQNNISPIEILGEKQSVCGTIFVEDNVSKVFLMYILEYDANHIFKRFLIEDVGSSSQIDKCLQFIKTSNIKYLFIGIYDEDKKSELDEKNKYNWPFCFLPVTKDVETEFFSFMINDDNIFDLSEKLGRAKDELVLAISLVSGEDRHDKILDLCKHLGVDIKTLLKAFYEIWRQKNAGKINDFLEELNCKLAECSAV